MIIEEIKDLLSAKVCSGQTLLSLEIENGTGTDDINQIMAFAKRKAVLITGLATDEVVRTAKMMNIHCIIFVRGIMPDPKVIHVAEELKIVLLATDHRMFDTCGILYAAGLGQYKDEEE